MLDNLPCMILYTIRFVIYDILDMTFNISTYAGYQFMLWFTVSVEAANPGILSPGAWDSGVEESKGSVIPNLGAQNP